MGTSTSFAQFARKARHAATEIQGSQRRGVAAAALLTKETIQHQSGYAERLRGVGSDTARRAGGAKLGVRYDVRGTGGDVSALVRATGPFQLIERDTRPHVIRPRIRGKRALAGAARRGERTADRRAILTPQGPRASARHPGTQGRHPFARGVTVARPLTVRAFQAGVTQSMIRAFR